MTHYQVWCDCGGFTVSFPNEADADEHIENHVAGSECQPDDIERRVVE